MLWEGGLEGLGLSQSLRGKKGGRGKWRGLPEARTVNGGKGEECPRIEKPGGREGKFAENRGALNIRGEKRFPQVGGQFKLVSLKPVGGRKAG